MSQDACEPRLAHRAALPPAGTASLDPVLPEIGAAFAKALARLQEFPAAGRDPVLLRQARAALHEVQGVLRVIGLRGAAQVIETVEHLLARWEDAPDEFDAQSPPLMEDALETVLSYLESLKAGQPDQPIRMFATYRALLAGLRAARVAAADLVFPDVTRDPPIAGGAEPPTPEQLRQRRGQFEQGLLGFLRDPGDTEARRAMCDALNGVECLPLEGPARGFWWVVRGLLTGLAEDQLPVDVDLKRLLTRVNSQLRRLIEGSPAVSERLLVDALFHVGLVDSAQGPLAEIQRWYDLKRLIPADYDSPQHRPTEPARQTELKESLREAKMRWSPPSGEPLVSEQFQGALRMAQAKAAGLRAAPVAQLLAAIADTAGSRSTLAAVPTGDALSDEITDALLLAEVGADIASGVEPRFEILAGIAGERLAAAQAGRPLPPVAADLLELPRRAFYRQAVCAAMIESRTKLREIEQWLDRFFRSPDQRDELASAIEQIGQVTGLFQILGQDDASAALRDALRAVERFARETTAEAPECARIAQNLCALGFFVEALTSDDGEQDGRFQWHEATATFSADVVKARGDESIGADAANRSRRMPRQYGDNAEAAARTHLDRARMLAQRLVEGDGSALPKFEKVLRQLQSDADLLDDDDLKQRTARVAALMRQADGAGDDTRLAELGRVFAVAAPAAPAPRQDVAAYAGTADLLRLFIDEAGQILGRVDEAIACLFADAADRASMMAIRQAFHTLKGSGRMAAQERIGDAASSVEQCFNYWLAQERAANADLILLTCFARDQMAAWIGALRSDPAAAVDCSDVAATAERVRKGEPFTVRGLGGADRNDTDLPEFEFEETSEPADASTGEVKQIGPVILDRREYVEFLNDADEHIRTVSQDFSEWRFEQRPPSQAALHCCHLLAQAVARIGLAPVTAIAAPLDVLLQALAEHGGAQQPLDSIQFDVLEGAVTRMRGMLHQFAADIYPSAAPVDADAVRALLGSVQAQGARPSPAAAPHDEAVSDIESSLDPELQRIFAMEGSDLLREIGAGLRTLVARPDDEDTAQQVLRLLHTAKGSARMAGAMQLGEVLHTMEARLQGAAESRETPKQAIEALQAALDEAMVLFERVTAPPPAAAGATAADGAIPSLPSTMNGPEAAHPVAETVGAASSFIRVRTDLLDRLVDHIGEFSITRAKMDSQIGAVHTALGELSQSLQRLRAQMRDLEIQADAQIQAHSDQMSRAPAAFDPLEHDRYTGLQELTRMLRETIEDVSAVQSGMSKSLQAAESDLAAQGRLSREIHQEFLRVRLVTFEQVAERLHHVVRQTARETGKQVQLTLRGESTEIDRGVLEKMAGPFEHLLRNAVVHGIEAPEARLAAGKPEGGEIRIDVSQQAGEIVVTIADDGAGLDVEAVRRRAIESGLVAADQPFGQRDAIGLIFAPGFTTVREATKLAGRGVGLDAVHSELSSFGGRIAISSERDRGMRFTLHLPPTLTVMQALLALVGDRHYAIPAGIVERVVRLDRDVLSRQIKEGALSDAQAGQIVLRPLAQLLGGKVALTRARQMPVLILRSDADRLAIAVDDISIQQEVIVKKIGSAARLSGMLGATIIGSGEIVLIVDPMQLITRAPEPPLLTEFAASDGRSTEAGTTPDDLPPRIMIVDDSMTVRRVTQRLLERNGMIASEARNGVEALQRIAAEDPDLMLVDIEMPHMDGFELLRKLREEPATQALPVIMITSRIGDKHRRLAAELGANEYLGKPYQDDELLRLIHRHLPAEHAGQ